MSRLRHLVSRGLTLLGTAPLLMAFLGDAKVGCLHGVGFTAKLRLLVQFRRNSKRLETLTNIRELIEMATAILAVPPSVPGDVVECGCYLGGSSVNISLVCALAGRKLVICDSFEGLPEPRDYDRLHANLHHGDADEYYKGRFAASLDVVTENIRRLGRLEVCEFVPGFFDQTLPTLNRKLVMAFLDVDLIDSLKPCLIGIWPNMADRCRVYVHEAGSLSLVSLFFDHGWWNENLHEGAPGFVGSGSGLPLTLIKGSMLGYAQKGTQLVLPTA